MYETMHRDNSEIYRKISSLLQSGIIIFKISLMNIIACFKLKIFLNILIHRECEMFEIVSYHHLGYIECNKTYYTLKIYLNWFIKNKKIMDYTNFKNYETNLI